MNFKRLSDIDVKGKRVFIRADLNVPQDDSGRITDDTRIRASLPAIQDALIGGAAVMVTSHLGRPTEGEVKPEDSLAPVAAALSELLTRPVPLLAERELDMRSLRWHPKASMRRSTTITCTNCEACISESKVPVSSQAVPRSST